MMVTTSMETELAHLAFTQALVVRQLLTQAEVHGCTLSIDQSELENQKALNDIKLYEEEKTKNPDLKPNLMSLSGKQGKPILQQLNELQDENKRYKTELANMKQQLAMAQEAANRVASGSSGLPPAAGGLPAAPMMQQPVMVDGSSAPPAFPGAPGGGVASVVGGMGGFMAPAGGLQPLGVALPVMSAGIDGRPTTQASAPGGGLVQGAGNPGDMAAATGGAVAGPGGGLMAPGGRMGGSASVGGGIAPMADAALAGQVDKLKGQLKAKNSEMMAMKKELSGKVGETTQYMNLKKMMTKKTEELKRFKAEMVKYDSKFGNASDDDDVVDDDK